MLHSSTRRHRRGIKRKRCNKNTQGAKCKRGTGRKRTHSKQNTSRKGHKNKTLSIYFRLTKKSVFNEEIFKETKC